jgi:ribosomal protein S18 acetylase RimI-like enzyme
MNIRAAQLSDMDLVYGLDASYQSDHVWQLSNKASNTEITAILRLARLPRPITVQSPHDETALRRTLHRADFLWVAESTEGSRDITGYLAMTLLPWQHTAWVTMLVVRPDQRRQGIASRLLATAGAQARSDGMHSLTVDVATKNYPATRLVQARNFKLTGYSENFYQSHEIALTFATRIR